MTTLPGDMRQPRVNGAMRTLEAIADGERVHVYASWAQALLEYIRGLEKRLEAPLVQGDS